MEQERKRERVSGGGGGGVGVGVSVEGVGGVTGVGGMVRRRVAGMVGEEEVAVQMRAGKGRVEVVGGAGMVDEEGLVRMAGGVEGGRWRLVTGVGVVVEEVEGVEVVEGGGVVGVDEGEGGRWRLVGVVGLVGVEGVVGVAGEVGEVGLVGEVGVVVGGVGVVGVVGAVWVEEVRDPARVSRSH